MHICFPSSLSLVFFFCRKYVYKSLFLGYKKCQTFQLFEDVYNLNRELSFPFKVPKAFPLKNSFTTDFLCVVSEFILQGVPILHLEKLPLNPFVLWAKKNLLEVRKYSAKSKSKSCGEISQVKVFTVQSQQVILYMNLGTFLFFLSIQSTIRLQGGNEVRPEQHCH